MRATSSSAGATALWYHTWKKPDVGDQDTPGADVHVGLLGDRLRVTLGSRDVTNFTDQWYLSLGVTDVPGAIYWLTR